MVIVVVMISDIGEAGGSGPLSVQPPWGSGLQKFMKLKMHRPYEPSTPHPASAYGNTLTSTRVGEAEETGAEAWNGILGSREKGESTYAGNCKDVAQNVY